MSYNMVKIYLHTDKFDWNRFTLFWTVERTTDYIIPKTTYGFDVGTSNTQYSVQVGMRGPDIIQHCFLNICVIYILFSIPSRKIHSSVQSYIHYS